MCKLTQCCCCSVCTLQTGTKIIGFLYMIGGVVGLIQPVVEIEEWHRLEAPVEQLVYSIAGIILSAVGILTTILLLIAALWNDKPFFLVPWLIFNMLYILTAIGILLTVGAVFLDSNVEMAIVCFCVVPLFALPIYFWIVVYSYLHELKNNRRMKTGSLSTRPNPPLYELTSYSEVCSNSHLDDKV